MKLKKLYTYKTKGQIWRILLSDKNRLIIEDRDPQIKEVFFNCFDAATGRKIFSGLQLNEKFWIGIESIYKEIIYFHLFQKPDMPGHKGIIAYSIDDQAILWENESHNFLFIKDDRIYAYKQLFESRNFYTLDYSTGNLVEDLGTDSIQINKIRENLSDPDNYKNYYFPEALFPDSEDPSIYQKIREYIDDKQIAYPEYIKYEDFLFMNSHKKENGALTNTFFAIDLRNGKLVMKEILNKNIRAVVPDSFFIKDNILFLLKEKKEVIVYRVSQ